VLRRPGDRLGDAPTDAQTAALQPGRVGGSCHLQDDPCPGHIPLRPKAVPKGDLPAISFTLHADGKSTVRTPDGEFETSSVIDPSKKPKTVDIEYLGGVFKGQKQYGIYKVEGDRWTVFSTPPGGKPEDRPKDFDSKTAKGGLVVWERIKDDKKR
jgi:uncharacterized protein (TIGR03067 family)